MEEDNEVIELLFYPIPHKTVRELVYELNSACNLNEEQAISLIDAINKGRIRKLKIKSE
jgi:hypothetical protein